MLFELTILTAVKTDRWTGTQAEINRDITWFSGLLHDERICSVDRVQITVRPVQCR